MVSLLIDQLSGLFLIFLGLPKTNCVVPYIKVDSKDEDFLGISDHYPLYFKIEVEFTTEETIRTKRLTGPKNIE